MADEYSFHIDAFTPETLPMGRLAEYMSALAALLANEHSTHFVRLDEGSAVLVHKVDAPDAPKVQMRLAAVAAGQAPADAERAMERLDDLLASDNAVGRMVGPTGDTIVEFAGRNRPRALPFPSLRQEGSIDGNIVSIGGRDATSHIILEDGRISYSNIELPRDLARRLAGFLYGPKVRLFGSGRWERHADGTWKLLRFSVDRFEILDEASLSEVLTEIRSLNSRLGSVDIYGELSDQRDAAEELH